MNTDFWADAEQIAVYTRADAIDDGALVDVSETAREAGFRYPVALTGAAWGLIENIPAAYGHEDVDGRLWDVLWMGVMAARRAPGDVDRVSYRLTLHTDDAGELVDLVLHIGPGDAGEPVITIMLPGED